MKTIAAILLSIAISVSRALASGGREFEDLGVLAISFIAFGVLIVVFQFVPGLMLLGGMLKEMFAASGKKTLNIGSK